MTYEQFESIREKVNAGTHMLIWGDDIFCIGVHEMGSLGLYIDYGYSAMSATFGEVELADCKLYRIAEEPLNTENK